MSQFQIETRYAKAAYSWMSQRKTVEEGLGDMHKIASLGKRKDLLDFFVRHGNKQSLLQNTLNALCPKLAADSQQFLRFLAKKKRLQVVFGIAKQFIAVNDQKLGIKRAVLVSASRGQQGLGKDFTAKVKSFLKQRDGNDYQIVEKNDPRLMGGFKIVIQHTVLDYSIANKLQRIEKKMLQGE